MDRIVVGVDGSTAAEAAAGWAARLAVRAGAELVVAHGFGPAEAELPPGRIEGLRHDNAAHVRAWATPAEQEGARVRVEVTDGEPVSALLSLAEDEKADLLVVGTRGAGGFPGLHLGSVAHHLAHHTTRPLGIIPLQGADLPPDTVVIGVDGSTGSDAAVRWTAAVAPAIGARVLAVHASEPFLEWLPESDRQGWRQKTAIEAGRWVNPIRRAHGDVEIVIDRDVHPVAALTRVASEHDAGLAVVGTRGLGGFTGLRLGRVPIQLVHHLGRPVVMVPPTE